MTSLRDSRAGEIEREYHEENIETVERFWKIRDRAIVRGLELPVDDGIIHEHLFGHIPSGVSLDFVGDLSDFNTNFDRAQAIMDRYPVEALEYLLRSLESEEGWIECGERFGIGPGNLYSQNPKELGWCFGKLLDDSKASFVKANVVKLGVGALHLRTGGFGHLSAKGRFYSDHLTLSYQLIGGGAWKDCEGMLQLASKRDYHKIFERFKPTRDVNYENPIAFQLAPGQRDYYFRRIAKNAMELMEQGGDRRALEYFDRLEAVRERQGIEWQCKD